jgi:GAF domain-containing protein
MDPQLSALLSSFVEAHAGYTLARLEFCVHHCAKPAPPVVGCFTESPEGSVRAQWHRIEIQLDEALAFAQRLERARRRRRTSDRALRLLAQSLRELDHAARAIRWMLTVTETHYDP